MRALCGVINTGEQLRAHTWHISVPSKFSLCLDYIHFRLPVTRICKQGAHVTVQSADNLEDRWYAYCGYRIPWHLALLNSTAIVTYTEGPTSAKAPKEYYFVLTYYAFDCQFVIRLSS